VAYRKLGQLDKAVADLSRAIALNPKYAKAWCYRGENYFNQGQRDKAFADFAKAIELEPKLGDAWCSRGITYNMLGQFDEAVADLSKAIELTPTNAHAWSHRGFAYRFLGQFEKAAFDLSRCIELGLNQSELVQAYRLRAQAYCHLARFAPARSDYLAALKCAPANPWILNELAWLLATCPEPGLRDPRQAVQLAGKAVEVAPKLGDTWNTLGVAHYRAGNWKAAVAALDKSAALRQGGDAFDYLFLTMAHWQLGNPDSARNAYTLALQWLEKNKKTLQEDQHQAEELRSIRNEAEEVLRLKK
jgi:tetratricopeptide (TPR) repeat protein